MVYALSVGDKFSQPVGGYRVGNDATAWMLAQDDGSDEGNECVAVDGGTIAADNGGAVYIGVEDDSQIGSMLSHGLTDGLHGLLVFWIGHMVGKPTIRI